MATMLVTTKGADFSTKATVRDLSHMIDSVVEDKFDAKKDVGILTTYMDINDCSSCVYFECTKRTQRLWIASPETTLRFNVLSHSSIYDLSFPVNYHKNSGHVMLFSKDFDEDEHLGAVKGMLEEAFKPRENAPIERAIGFFFLENRICIRSYLVDGVLEIGPRIDIELDRIFEGCFRGPRVYGRPEEQ